MPNPVRPQHAATLVAWRRGPSGLEVLMGRRAARHRFVPHRYVFPGGRVDRADYAAVPRSPLRAPVLHKLCRSGDRRLAQALAVTAVRETWEETGLVLGTLRGNGELLDLAWRPVTECLKLPIVDVTEYFLGRLQDDAFAGAHEAKLFSFRGGKARLT